MAAKPHEPPELVRFVCPHCRSKGQLIGHYDVIRCGCGAFSWALRPKRSGPLVIFPHPGFYA